MKKMLVVTSLVTVLFGLWYLCANHVVTSYPGVVLVVSHRSAKEYFVTVVNGSRRSLTYFGDSDPNYRVNIVHEDVCVEHTPAYCGVGMDFRELSAGGSATIPISHLDELAKPGDKIQVVLELYALSRVPQLGATIIRLKSEPFVFHGT